MTIILKGVMQSTVTPLREDFSPDLPTFERLVEFHIRTGATAISWPHHKAESLNLTIAERKLFAEAAVKVTAGRVPVSIHVSALALEDTMELARHAQKIGADAIIAITPYFWNPSNEALYDYFVRLGTSIDLPLVAYNSPGYLSGVEMSGELTKRLIERLPNFIAMKEASFNSEIFLEIARVALALRPNFRGGIPPPLGASRGRRILFLGRGDLSQPLHPALRGLCFRRVGTGARPSVQAVKAVGPVPRSVSIVPQRRDGDHGTPRRAHPGAAADREPRTTGIHPYPTGRARHPGDRTPWLVIPYEDTAIGELNGGYAWTGRVERRS
jgi:hypothetical protein